MGSLPPLLTDQQARPFHSVADRRERATVKARRKWSASLILRAMACSDAYGIARSVLVVLLLLADGSHVVCATVQDIADLAGMTKEAARWHLRHLRETGDITVTERGRGKGNGNTYRLDVIDRVPPGGDAA